jgi:hypothetical protein
MRSPAEYWKEVPKEPQANAGYRRWVLRRAAASKRVREHVKQKCRDDLAEEDRQAILAIVDGAGRPADER